MGGKLTLGAEADVAYQFLDRSGEHASLLRFAKFDPGPPLAYLCSPCRENSPTRREQPDLDQFDAVRTGLSAFHEDVLAVINGEEQPVSIGASC